MLECKNCDMVVLLQEFSERKSSVQANDDLISKMAEIGARSAWSLYRWDVMDSFVQMVPVRSRCG